MLYWAKFRADRCRSNVDEIWPFFDFSRWRLRAYWVCFTRVFTSHEEHLVVFVTVQNVVGIGSIVSIIWNLIFCVFEGVGPLYRPLNGEWYQQTPQKAHPLMQRRRMTHRSSKLVKIVKVVDVCTRHPVPALYIEVRHVRVKKRSKSYFGRWLIQQLVQAVISQRSKQINTAIDTSFIAAF